MACLAAVVALEKTLHTVESQVASPIVDFLVTCVYLWVRQQNAASINYALEVDDHDAPFAPDECIMAECLEKLTALCILCITVHIPVVAIELHELALELVLAQEEGRLTTSARVLI